MNYTLHQVNAQQIAELETNQTVINNAQQFLEILMNAPAERIIVRKENLDEAFFDLKTGLAGEMLQKVVNYGMRLAIVGDYTGYPSKSLRDFIYESNKSNNIMFMVTVDEALKRLSL